MENSLLIGSPEGEHVTIVVVDRAFPDASDPWDGNWLQAWLRARLGGFVADVLAGLRTDELARFARELASIADSRSGTAVLDTLEEQIHLTVECRPNGGLRVVGRLADQAGGGNQLTFELTHLDQTHLAGWLRQLEAIDTAFPTVGHP